MARQNKFPRNKRKDRSRAKQRGHDPSSDRAFESKKRAFDAVAKMRRHNVSPDVASRQAGTTLVTVKKYLPTTLRKTRTGRWVVTKSDRYVRFLSLPGPHGPVIRPPGHAVYGRSSEFAERGIRETPNRTPSR
jgi:hypothetical protein